VLITNFASAQITGGYLHENTVKIDKLTKLDGKLYNKISTYTYFAIGEMHGTVEPSEFVID
jgi:hypothetical protein